MNAHIPLVILMGILFNIGYTQDIAVVKEEVNSINKFADSIEEIKTFNGSNPLPIAIKVLKCEAAIGGYDAIDAIQYDLYIRVKQATENNYSGEYGWFWIRGKFIEPRNYIFTDSSRILSFDYGPLNDVHTVKLKVSYEKIEIQ